MQEVWVVKWIFQSGTSGDLPGALQTELFPDTALLGSPVIALSPCVSGLPELPANLTFCSLPVAHPLP